MVGPFFIQENDETMNPEGAGPHVIRPGTSRTASINLIVKAR